MLGTPTALTGLWQASPGREQRGVLAVINHVSGAGIVPPERTGRGPLVSLAGSGPHLIPRVDDAPVLPRRARITGDAAFPSEAPAAALGLRAGGGGLFQFGLTARQPASNRSGQGSKRLPCVGALHANQHEVADGQEVGRVVQGRGNVHQ